MFHISKIYLIILVLFFGCTSTSMEFRSAKSAVRAEKNLNKGELWGLKALKIEKDNALIPYFLATEIYKHQEKWEELAEMLDEAMRRNPEQKLEKPKYLIDSKDITKENIKESIAYTIKQGVNAYRQELWGNIFNQAVGIMKEDIQDNRVAEKLNFCIRVLPNRVETYAVMVEYYYSNNNLEKAKEYVDKGLNIEPSYQLYQFGTEILNRQFMLSTTPENPSGDISFIQDAEKMCLQAIQLAKAKRKNTEQLKTRLFLIYLDLGKNQ